MIFSSLTFLCFFISFFFLYWFVFNKSVKHQNLILLFASYIFYAWADWRFLSYLIGISLFNYLLGIYIEKNTKYKRLLLNIGLLQSIGALAFFKYFNFFIASFNDLFLSFNVNLNLQTLNIIIPLGISYFTFRIISYLLDIDKGKIIATKDIIVFFNYVSFFPSIISGPIDKARDFVPQLENKREFNYDQATNGMLQFIWGFFKKLVIADNCAVIVNTVFDNSSVYGGSTLLLGAVFYAFQLYADFSGYSDMAIGIGRLLGINVTKNFDFPYFSQNIAEFWRKWHISLTSWLTEYVFTPLSIAFRDYGKAGLILAIVINFVIIGLWHGANSTYIVFGFIHGCLFIPIILKGALNKKKKKSKNKILPTWIEVLKMFATFIIVTLTLVFFRAKSVGSALNFISNIFKNSIFAIPPKGLGVGVNITVPFLLLILFVLVEWFGRNGDYAIDKIRSVKKQYVRWSLYSLLIFIIIMYMKTTETPFIYIQY
jgi:alginate O-acetyltransferase complex protein AlgI